MGYPKRAPDGRKRGGGPRGRGGRGRGGYKSQFLELLPVWMPFTMSNTVLKKKTKKNLIVNVYQDCTKRFKQTVH